MKNFNTQELYEKLHHIEKLFNLSNVKYLTAEEASEFLGFTITYLYELTSKRVIPFYKPSGKKLLFKKSDLTGWIEKSRHKSTEEIKNELIDKEL